MAFQKGITKVAGSGRKSGVKNKFQRRTAWEIAEKVGYDPLEGLVQTASDISRKMKPSADDRRIKALCERAAAPYLHAQLNRTEMTGPGGGPIQTALIDWSTLTDEQLAKAKALAEELGLAKKEDV